MFYGKFPGFSVFQFIVLILVMGKLKGSEIIRQKNGIHRIKVPEAGIAEPGWIL